MLRIETQKSYPGMRQKALQHKSFSRMYAHKGVSKTSMQNLYLSIYFLDVVFFRPFCIALAYVPSIIWPFWDEAVLEQHRNISTLRAHKCFCDAFPSRIIFWMFLHRFGKMFDDFWAVLGWICNCETIVDSVKDSSEHLINISLCTTRWWWWWWWR